jgi:hypothetical protein
VKFTHRCEQWIPSVHITLQQWVESNGSLQHHQITSKTLPVTRERIFLFLFKKTRERINKGNTSTCMKRRVKNVMPQKNRNMLIKAYALFSLRACLVLPVLSWIFEEE